MDDALLLALAVVALCLFTVVFVGGLTLLAVFVRQAVAGLLAIRELREETVDAQERRETVTAAQRAVEDIRHGSYGESGDVDMELLAAVHKEAAMNGKPYRTYENEARNQDEPEAEYTPEGFYVPTEQQ